MNHTQSRRTTWKRPAKDDVGLGSVPGIEKQKLWSSSAIALLPPISTTSLSHFRPTGHSSVGAVSDRQCLHHRGDSSAARDLQTFHFKRHFSEDSGISSCGSSASSVADDIEAATHLTKAKTSFRTNRLHSYHGVPSAPHSGFQSRTVAAVLAAGVASDSEETDDCASEEESDSVFTDDGMINISKKHSRSSSENDSSMALGIRSFLQKTVSDSDSSPLKQEKVHVGRDILDLGTNLRMKFPFQASKLPAKNLPLFLQNRSQYHRLGKFGTSETFLFAKCEEDCGFTFPVPPSKNC